MRDDKGELLQLVDLEWIRQVMGDKTLTATRRWTERLRAKGILKPVPLPGRRLRFRKLEIEKILQGNFRQICP
jgi:hypothetical protein